MPGLFTSSASTYVDLGSDFQFKKADRWTLAAFFNPTTISGENRLILGRVPSDSSARQFAWEIDATYNTTWCMFNNWGQNIYGTISAITTNRDYLGICWCSGGSSPTFSFIIYDAITGQVVEKNLGASIGTSDSLFTSGSARIGQRETGSGSANFIGRIGHTCIIEDVIDCRDDHEAYRLNPEETFKRWARAAQGWTYHRLDGSGKDDSAYGQNGTYAISYGDPIDADSASVSPLSIFDILAPAASGATTHEASITFDANPALAQSNNANFNTAGSFGVNTTFTATNLANVLAASNLVLINGLASVNDAVMGGALTLSSTFAQSALSGTVFEADASLVVNNTIAPLALISIEAALSFAVISALTQGDEVVFQGDIGLGLLPALSATNTAVMEASRSDDAGHSFASTTGSIFSDSAAFGVTPALSQSGIISIEGSAGLTVTASLMAQVVAVLEPSITINTVQAAVLNALAVFEAAQNQGITPDFSAAAEVPQVLNESVSLAVSVDVSAVGQVVLLSLTTPDERTFLLTASDRSFTLQPIDRKFN